MATRIINGVVFHIESTNTLVAVLDSAADADLNIGVIVTASSGSSDIYRNIEISEGKTIGSLSFDFSFNISGNINNKLDVTISGGSSSFYSIYHTTENIEGQVGYYQINVDLSKYTYVDISNYRKIIHFQGNDTLGYWTNTEGRIIGEDIIPSNDFSKIVRPIGANYLTLACYLEDINKDIYGFDEESVSYYIKCTSDVPTEKELKYKVTYLNKDNQQIIKTFTNPIGESSSNLLPDYLSLVSKNLQKEDNENINFDYDNKYIYITDYVDYYDSIKITLNIPINQDINIAIKLKNTLLDLLENYTENLLENEQNLIISTTPNINSKAIFEDIILTFSKEELEIKEKILNIDSPYIILQSQKIENIYNITDKDLENGYALVDVSGKIRENSDFGFILFRFCEYLYENDKYYILNSYNNDLKYLFYFNKKDDKGGNIYDYINKNTAVDFGNAFSEYIKPKDILEHGNASTKIFSDLVEDGKVIGSRYSSLIVNFQLYKIPFNLGFLNIRDYYLTYYRNNGIYSNEELEDIISQKFVPYSGYKLFVNIDKLINTSYKPMKFLKFETKNSIGWSFDTGKLYCYWKGGCPIYNILIKGILIDKSEFNQNYTSENGILDIDIPVGTFDIYITDSINNILSKKTFSVLKPEIITCNFKIYTLPGNKSQILSKEGSKMYDEIHISLNGGTLPYRVKYTTYENKTESIIVENSKFVILDKMKLTRNVINSFEVTDNNNQSVTINILNDKYYEMYDNGEGSCVLLN